MTETATTICLLTDYGLRDEFVGVLHSVIARISPTSKVIDLTHGITRHDIRAGSLALWRAAPYLPSSVVVAIVDPGVGTARRAVAIEVGGRNDPIAFVGPDNSLLLPAALRLGPITAAVELDDPRWHLAQPAAAGLASREQGGTTPAPVGSTFAGRDVFAPAAAHLAAGVDLRTLGSPIDPLGLQGEALSLAAPGTNGRIDAHVLWVDGYGNVQLDVSGEDLPPPGSRVTLTASGERFDVIVVSAYQEMGSEPGLVVDSVGLAELALFGGDAASTYRLAPGDPVGVKVPSEAVAGTLEG